MATSNHKGGSAAPIPPIGGAPELHDARGLTYLLEWVANARDVLSRTRLACARSQDLAELLQHHHLLRDETEWHPEDADGYSIAHDMLRNLLDSVERGVQ